MKKIINYLIVLLAIFIIPLSGNAKEKDITLYLFHGDGCPHCAEEISFLDSISNEYDNLNVVKYEVWYNDENAALLTEVEKAFDIKKNSYCLARNIILIRVPYWKIDTLTFEELFTNQDFVVKNKFHNQILKPPI